MKVGRSQLSTSTSLGGGQLPTGVGLLQPHPMAVLLFGKRPPPLVDRRRHPKLQKTMRKLDNVCDQIAELVGRSGEDFELALCEGENASIDRRNRIAIGAELLEEHQEDDDLLVAILGHEIGHQPWRWPTELPPMTKKQLDALYREEEARADHFAGVVLAELGADPVSICDFLRKAEGFEGHEPSDYYPAKTRAQMIHRAFEARLRRLATATAMGLPSRARQLR